VLVSLVFLCSLTKSKKMKGLEAAVAETLKGQTKDFALQDRRENHRPARL
jgi:hypothetical protein